MWWILRIIFLNIEKLNFIKMEMQGHVKLRFVILFNSSSRSYKIETVSQHEARELDMEMNHSDQWMLNCY